MLPVVFHVELAPNEFTILLDVIERRDLRLVRIWIQMHLLVTLI